MRTAGVWILGLLTALGSTATTRADDLDPTGRPEGTLGKQAKCYYVWRDKDGYHVRFTTAKFNHRFSGTVTVDAGAILKVAAVKKGSVDGRGDWWQLSERGRRLTFDVQTKRELDGLDFKIGRRVREVTFVLKIDGEQRAERIFVGSSSASPKDARFTLPARN